MSRENGLRWLLDGDIDAFFDSVDHELLLHFLRADLPDASLLPLISAWLEGMISPGAPRRGIPQGSPLSPLLANVYLHRFDQSLVFSGYQPVRYADDFIVLASSRHGAEEARDFCEQALAALALQLEPAKTRIASFDEGFTFLGIEFWEDSYRYTWEGRTVIVRRGDEDALSGEYSPQYE